MRRKLQNHCRSCGKRIPSGLVKCLACLLNLRTKSDKNCKCLVCGTKIEMDDEECAICGTNFLEGAEVDAGLGAKGAQDFICMICCQPVDKAAKRCNVCGTVFVEDIEQYTGPIVERVGSGGSTPNPG